MNKIVRTEEHHRRSRCTGGTDDLSNISYVIPHLHRSWHTIFGSMNAFQICNYINKSQFLPEKTLLVCDFINGSEVKKTGTNGSRNHKKVSDAWINLFGKCSSFYEIISYINHMWIDPSYRLKIIHTK